MAGFYVVLTIVLFLGVELIVKRVRARRMAPASPAGMVFTASPVKPGTPAGVMFARTHTWVDPLSAGDVRLGLDDFLAGLLAGAEITLVKNEGDQVVKGEPLLVLVQNGQALAVRSPISGEIVLVNRSLEEMPGPGRPNDSAGHWAYTLRPGRPEEFRDLLTDSEARLWMSGELQRMLDFFSATSKSDLDPGTVPVGAIPAAGMILRLGPEGWKQFEIEFLQIRDRARAARQ